MAAKQYQIVLTMNGKQVESYLDTLKLRAKEVEKAMESMELAGKQDDEAYRDLGKELGNIRDIIKKGKQEMLKYEDVIQNLAATSLNNLRRALRQVKSDMGKTAENTGQMDSLRDAYDKITAQIKKMGAEWVNVTEMMKDLDSASEKQLRTALAQTKELHSNTSRTNAEYKNQIDIIRKLEEEIDKIASVKPVDPKTVMGDLGNATVKEIKLTIAEFEKLREETKAGGDAWNQYTADIEKCKQHLENLTKKKVDVNHIMTHLDQSSMKEIREAIAEMERLRDQTETGKQEWKDYTAEMDKAKRYLEELGKEKIDVDVVMNNLGDSTIDDIKTAIAEMEKLRGATVAGGNDWKRYTDQIRKAKDHLDMLTGKKVDVNKIMSNIDHSSVNEIKAAIAEMERLRDETEAGGKEWDRYTDDIEFAKKRLDDLTHKKLDLKSIMGNLDNATVNQIRQAIAEMEKLRNETKAGGIDWKKYTDDIDRAKERLDLLTGQRVDLNEIMINLDGSTMKEIKMAISQMEELRESAQLNSPAWEQLTSDIKKAKDQLKRFSDVKDGMTEDEAQDLGNGIGIDEKTVGELEQAVKVLENMKKALKPGDTAGLERLQKQIETINNRLGKTKDGFDSVENILKRLDTASIDELKHAAAELEKQINSMQRNAPDYGKKQRKLKEVRRRLDEINDTYRKQENAISRVMKRLSAYVLVYSGFNVIKDQLFDLVRQNFELSDSLADIRKTTGLANSEVERLSDNLLHLDTRTTARDLNALAFEAGRMGVGKFGVEGIEGFVKAANKLKVALGEDLGEDAIAQVYKLADVMGIVNKMGVENSLLSIGSAINELVQTGTSSGSFIVDFTSRMAGIAAQANLTTAEVAGFGSALDEMGQEVEVSATSMNKFVMQMFTHYKTVAKAADMSEESLKTMLENGHTADAIISVMEGLSKKGGLSLLAPLFADLGSDGARLSQTLSAMSSNVDKLKRSVNTAREAFNEARSVTNEYNIKNQTTAALLERIRNSWRELFVNSSNKGALHEFMVGLKDISDELIKNKEVTELFSGALKLLLVALRALIAVGPSLLAFLGIRYAVIGMGTAFQFLGGTVKSLVLILKPLTKVLSVGLLGSIKGVTAAFSGLSLAMKANVIGLVVSAAVALYSVLSDLNGEMDKTTGYLDSVDKSYKEYIKEMIKARAETDGLFRVLNSENSTTEERRAAIKKLNEEYGEYLPKMITEKDNIDAIRTAQENLNKTMEQGMAFRMKQQALIEALDPVYQEQADGLAKYKELYDKQTQLEADNKGYVSNFKGYAPDVFMAAARKFAEEGLSIEEIYSKVFQQAQEASGTTWDSSKGHDYSARNAMMNYIKGAFHEFEVRRGADAKFDPHIGNYGKETPKKTPIVQDDKKEKDKKGREDAAEAKKEYEALISKIKAYFALQVAAVKESFLKGQISEMTKNSYLEGLNTQRNNALMEARNSVSGRTNKWNDVKYDIGNLSFDESEDTMKLLYAIQNVDTKALHDILKNFGPEFIDQISNKAAENLVKVKDVAIGIQEEINKILLEDDFMEQNRMRFQQEFSRLNLMNTQAIEERMKMLGEEESTISRDIDNIWIRTFLHIREHYEELFDIDMFTAEGHQAFAKFLEPLSKDFPELVNKSEAELRVLYSKMMQLQDADDEAKRKAEKREEKLLKFRYGRTEKSQDMDARIKKQESDNKWGKVMNDVGLSSEAFMADQEVELYKLKLEAAAEYYEYVMTHAEEKGNMDKAQQELDQATMEMTEKLVAKVGEHLAYLKEYGDAIADFGTDFGAAIFGSLKDRQKTIEDLARAFGETTKKIIMDWVKQRIAHKLHTRLMKKEENVFQKGMTKDAKQSGDTRVAIEQATGNALMQSSQIVANKVAEISTKKTKKSVENKSKETQAKVAMDTAQGAGEAIAQLGPWGIPLIAVIEAVLNGLLSIAMSKVSSLFGGGSENVVSATKSKVVSGMLTYDSGNMQSISQFVGDDGIIYTVAKHVGKLETGLVTEPIATTVNGRASLVGERGPELVIGRETTEALMMNNPGILRYLVNFDKHHSGRSYQAYDKGNLNEVSLMGTDSPSALLSAIEDLTATNAALTAELKRGIRANINKYGKGGLVDEVVDGMLFEADKGNDPKIRRFFSRRN